MTTTVLVARVLFAICFSGSVCYCVVSIKRISERDACIVNLRTIVAAKGGYGLEFGNVNQEVDPTNLNLYIRGGWTSIICPSGGKYNMGLVTQDKEDPGNWFQSPRCSVHGSAKNLFHETFPRDVYILMTILSFLMAISIFLGNRSRGESGTNGKRR